MKSKSRTVKVQPPSDDKRWLLINATMRRHGYRPHALIETLHTVQESFGFIDNESLAFVSEGLNVPLSQTLGVASFYHFFSMKPRGKHQCVVCTGTACYIKGAGDIMRALGQAYGLADGETTPDDELSLLTARCVGACGIAPVVVLDNEFIPRVQPETAVETLQNALAAKEAVTDGS
ncbi:MAG: NAD(P)H-dependent oxidoreductase subunit E [Anaerolineales bacterium]